VSSLRFLPQVRTPLPQCSPAEKQLVRATLTRLIEEINAMETAIFNPSTFITQVAL